MRLKPSMRFAVSRGIDAALADLRQTARAAADKTGVPLAVMNDGSVWWAMMMTPSWYPFGPRPPARLQPEPASSRAAREEALAAAHLRVVRGSRLLVGALPLIDAYYVRVRLGSGVAETVGISPDGANAGVVNQAVLRPWPPKSE